jgi:hypothetical protein
MLTGAVFGVDQDQADTLDFKDFFWGFLAIFLAFDA